MSNFEYHRPETLEQALALLKQGLPLAGGTVLSVHRREIPGVIDLDNLGLDEFVLDENKHTAVLGGMLRLQSLIEAELPPALIRALRQEAGWNLRNAASIAGAIVTADGRSPLLTALLSMDVNVILLPREERLSLEVLLEDRTQKLQTRLIRELHMSLPERMAYHQVARAPLDRPLVCLAMTRSNGALRMALGGFGAAPRLVADIGDAAAAADAAREAFAEAQDAWASADYRADVAATLAQRAAREVLVT